ncbi:putative Band 7 domain-containing protein [Seiridium cardinale]|uniref:Band 7 domain-containing protein n=1 Tax=Seiridium cardinale TaxID=138064 RepID=A0ABR2XYV8_9PEZI
MSYRVAAPDEYLAITGMGVKNVHITKTAWVWPFQRCKRFSVQPHDYAMNLQAMTKEKLQFLLPVVFTIGPDVNSRGANAKGAPKHASTSAPSNHPANLANEEDRGDALMKFAMLLSESENSTKSNKHGLEQIVKGIIEGETRVLVSSMTMEEIFTEREEFKRRIFRNIQVELDQFGLKIYNANVKELKDAEGSVYFQSLSQKAHEGATNQARIDVADAQLRGNVGTAERHGRQEQEIAKINAETAVKKTERDAERARAEAVLKTQEAALNRDVELSRIEAARATQSKDEDLKKQVEVKRAAAELERMRATDLVKAQIKRESQQEAADAKAYEITVDAKAKFEQTTRATDATAYKTKIDAQTQAEADFNKLTKHTDAAAYKTKMDAEAYSQAAIKNAEARLQEKLKEAEGMAAMAEAYGKLGQAFGGPAGLLQYMMIEKGTYVELAHANADAIRGLQPKISVWNTGAAGEGAGQDSTSTMRNVYQMLPPLMTTINEQTGITLPEWQFGRLAGELNNGVDKNVSPPKTNGTQARKFSSD